MSTTATSNARDVVARRTQQVPAERFNKITRGYGATFTRSPFGPIDFVPPATHGKWTILSSCGPRWRLEEADKICLSISNPDEFSRRAGRSHDALLVNHVVPFIFNYKKVGDDIFKLKKLEEETPELLWAYHVGIDKSNLLKRFFIEALILGRCPTAEIAKICGVPETCIWWFEKIFFDVRSRIDEGRWVVVEVLFPIISRADQHHVQNFLWKAVCWRGILGWKQFLNLFDYGDKMSEENHNFILNMLNSKLLIDTFAALSSRQPNRFNENFIMDQYIKIVEIERGNAPAQKTAATEISAKLLSSITNAYKMASVDTASSGTEPRAHEELSRVYEARRKEAAKGAGGTK